MHILHACSACEHKNCDNLNDRIFCVNFDLATQGEDRIQTASVCQIFERPTQRFLINRMIETETKKVINLERDHHAVL